MASDLPPPPPPPPPPAPTLPMPPLPLPESQPAPRDAAGWLVFLVGIAVTVALVVATIAAWPDDEGPESVAVDTATTLMTKEAADALPEQPSSPDLPATTTTIAVDLFAVGPGAAVDDVLEAADHPTELIELAIYPTYLFVAYRDVHDTNNIDRRMWRGGNVDDPDANPIEDRVDAETTPKLFGPGELRLDLIPQLVADATTRYDIPVEITHVLIDRFLPFDQRVLVRVYAQPTDGRSGGGYVSYTTDGTFVKVCC